MCNFNPKFCILILACPWFTYAPLTVEVFHQLIYSIFLARTVKQNCCHPLWLILEIKSWCLSFFEILTSKFLIQHYLSLSLSLSIYLCIHIHIYTNVWIKHFCLQVKILIFPSLDLTEHHWNWNRYFSTF